MRLYKKTIVGGAVDVSEKILARADKLELMGLGMMDARHLAAAEDAGAEYLLTTDEKFLKKCKNRSIEMVGA